MKTKLFLFFCLLAAIPLAAQEQEWFDVSELFLKNASFNSNFNYAVGDEGNVEDELLDIAPWQYTQLGAATVSGIYQFGTAATVLGSAIPATGFDGTPNGGCLVLAASTPKRVEYQQKIGTLAPGKYKLVVAFWNAAVSETGSSQLHFIPSRGTRTRSTLSSFPSQAWHEDSITFTISNATDGIVQIGYLARKNDQTGDHTTLFFDYVKLYRDHNIDAADVEFVRADLETLITRAEALTTFAGNAGAELVEAIAAAKAVADNAEASLADIKAAIDALQPVVNEFAAWEYTDNVSVRFVRGATRLFARVDVSGITASTIQSQGVCLSDTPKPTHEGLAYNRTLTSNGTIYAFTNLTPSTLYYLNSYVELKNGTVKYGKPVKLYTVPKGQVTCAFVNKSGNTETDNRIQNAINSALDYFNNMSSAIRNFQLGYSAGTPTADCNYVETSWINMGANSSYQRTGTIMHEMMHGLGLIPYRTQWNKNILRESLDGNGRGTGQWLGDRASQVVQFWSNGADQVLKGDFQHMWPYGINGANEDNGTEALYLANASICQALGEDGLEHNIWVRHADPYYSFTQEDNVKYYLKNESDERGLYTAFLTETADGKLAWQEMSNADARSNDHAAWYVTFTPDNQQYQFRNAATGKFLSLSGTTVSLSATPTPGTAQDFHLMKARVDAVKDSGMRGYWMVHTASWTPNCMAANANGTVGGAALNLANSATTQRWLILDGNEIDQLDQLGADAFKANLNNVLAQLEALQAVPHTEETEGTDAQLSQSITDIRTAADGATSAYAVSALVEQARQAEFQFLANATPTDVNQPFDLSLMIVNAGMDSADGWSQAPALNYSCGEFYQTTFNMNQVLKNMPAGTYQLRAKAFQRPGTTAQAYAAYTAGNETVTTYLYMGSNYTRVQNIAAGAQETKVGVGTEVGVGSPQVFVPNTMQAVAAYFARGLYENELTAEFETKGDIRLGIRCSTSNDSYWSIFDDFRLYYFGRLTAEQVTAIDETVLLKQKAESGKQHVVYDLSGRQVNQTESLRPGIYILDGKKIAVK